MEHTGAQPSAGVSEGDVLAGKYRVDKVLGVGGMGVVVAARHLQLDTRVAIKFMLPEMLGSQEAVGRFAREARAAVKITSEHVARVFDVGTLENGAPYMVMEFLEGEDLAAWVHRRGPLAIETAVEFVVQACVAIAEAHGLGIVHRDLKPANLFCTRRSDGQLSIKVLDFGISKLSELGGSGPGMSVTKTSAMMGSPLYMSPEQMQSSKDVGPQTDIWALGVVLYELVTGSVPFNGETLPEVCVKIATQPPPSLRLVRPDAAPGFENVVLRCLEKDRSRRYRSIAELAGALAKFGPPRVRASVERIAGIVQSAGLAQGPGFHGANFSPVGTTANTGASSTGLAVGSTAPQWATKSGGGRGARWTLIAVGALLAVGAAVTVAHLRSTASTDSATVPVAAAPLPPAQVPAATSQPLQAPVAAETPPVAVAPVAAPAVVPAPAAAPGPAQATTTAKAQTPRPATLARPPVATPPNRAQPAIAAPPLVATAPTAAAASSPPAPPQAHRPAPNANPLDLPLQ